MLHARVGITGRGRGRGWATGEGRRTGPRGVEREMGG